jgi:hypothetical protein
VVEDYVGGRLHIPTARILKVAHVAAALAVACSIWILASGRAG